MEHCVDGFGMAPSQQHMYQRGGYLQSTMTAPAMVTVNSNTNKSLFTTIPTPGCATFGCTLLSQLPTGDGICTNDYSNHHLVVPPRSPFEPILSTVTPPSLCGGGIATSPSNNFNCTIQNSEIGTTNQIIPTRSSVHQVSSSHLQPRNLQRLAPFLNTIHTDRKDAIDANTPVQVQPTVESLVDPPPPVAVVIVPQSRRTSDIPARSASISTATAIDTFSNSTQILPRETNEQQHNPDDMSSVSNPVYYKAVRYDEIPMFRVTVPAASDFDAAVRAFNVNWKCTINPLCRLQKTSKSNVGRRYGTEMQQREYCCSCYRHTSCNFVAIRFVDTGEQDPLSLQYIFIVLGKRHFYTETMTHFQSKR